MPRSDLLVSVFTVFVRHFRKKRKSQRAICTTSAPGLMFAVKLSASGRRTTRSYGESGGGLPSPLPRPRPKERDVILSRELLWAASALKASISNPPESRLSSP